MADKPNKPPYTSYRSFVRLVAQLRECEVLPHRVDRTFLSTRSGSEQSSLIATLKWFSLVEDDGVITQRFKNYVAADEAAGKALLKQMVEETYSFITDGTFDLQTATTAMLADQFRQYQISGSTLTKSVSFFLAAAKDVGIPVSPHVKAPPAKNGGARRKTKAPLPPAGEAPSSSKVPRPPREGMVAIPIPIFGGTNGVVYLPGNMTESQWTNVIKMTEFILQNYRETMGAEAPEREGGEP